jgi:hypothetical protein
MELERLETWSSSSSSSSNSKNSNISAFSNNRREEDQDIIDDNSDDASDTNNGGSVGRGKTTTSTSLKCMHKDISCKSAECEKVEECKNPTFKTHCYTIFKDNGGNRAAAGSGAVTSSNFRVKTDNSSSAVAATGAVEILYAGCWSGGDECEPPEYLKQKFKVKHNHDVTHYEYKIPDALLDKSVQSSCIGYAKLGGDESWLAKNNQTFCCCSSEACNR